MSTDNNVIEVAGIAITTEQLQQARQALVNADEVIAKTIEVKVRFYVEEPVLDDDGQAIPGDNGEPLKYRRAKVRTAKIQNAAPIEIYAKAMSIADNLQGMQKGVMPDSSAMETLRDMVLEVWQISEPWMTAKMLHDGIDGNKALELFGNFFDKLTRQ